MARQGRATIDFGSFPGTGDASVAVTGIADITADSLVEAWIVAEDTDDHSADEHLADPPRVIAGRIVPGTGFTIFGFGRQASTAPDPLGAGGAGSSQASPNGNPYGKWTVGWVWNE